MKNCGLYDFPVYEAIFIRKKMIWYKKEFQGGKKQ